MKILGIETSCDDTAAAVVEDGKIILSSVVSSQEEVHRKYGGVVPELASRKHIENIVPVIKAALCEAGVNISDLEGVAVTRGPGLIGSLLVGISAAKGLAYAAGLPLTGVNHLEAHFTAAEFEFDILYPTVAMVVSGGHTSLYYVRYPGSFELLGRTLDDAAGEAFDKVAKLLGLGYPGGPVIEKEAEKCIGEPVSYPRITLSKDSLDFSFSGLKTAVIAHVRKILGSNGRIFRGRIFGTELDKETISRIAAGFQKAVVEVLVDKAFMAARMRKVYSIIFSGGVACNGLLRKLAHNRARETGIKVFFPSPRLCTDNAAMVAAVGYRNLLRGIRAGLDLDAVSRIR